MFQNADDDTNENRVLTAYRATKTLDRRIVRGLVSDTLLNFYPCAAQAAKELQNSIQVKGRKEPLIVESLLAVLLPLTNARACRESTKSFQCYACRVLIYLLDAPAYPATFASAVASFVTNMSKTSISVIEMFNEMFVFMLSTLKLEWKWDHMVETKSKDTELCISWIRSVFTHLLNLVSVKSLRDAVPSELHEMIPEKDAYLLFDDDENDDETLVEKLRDDSTTVEDVVSASYDAETLTIAILRLGSSSLAETSSCLTKWAQVYSQNNDSDEIKILDTVLRAWSMQVMRVHEIVMKLLELKIVSHETVIKFCFDKIDSASGIFASSSHWKLLEKMVHDRPLVEKKREIFNLISKEFSARSKSFKSCAFGFFRALASENLEMHIKEEESDDDGDDDDTTLTSCTKYAYIPW